MLLSGVVFNEMKGVYSQPDNILGRTSQQVNLIINGSMFSVTGLSSTHKKIILFSLFCIKNLKLHQFSK